MSSHVPARLLRRPPAAAGIGFGAVSVAASLAAGALVANESLVRVALVVCLGTTVVGVGIRAPRGLLLALIGWLATLGLARRLFSQVYSSARLDPLLLVEPLIVVVLLLAARELGAFRRRTPLGTSVAVLTGLVLLGAVNPLQQSVFAGLASLIFFVPLAGFWIGRVLSAATFRRVLWLYAILALPAAAYGMLQVLGGFPSWDETWIRTSGYTSLQVLGSVRPFSAFSSASEYATFLEIAVVAWLVLARRALRPLSLAAVALVLVALFFESARGPIVVLFLAAAVLVAAARRLSGAGAAAVAVCFVTAVPFAAAHIGSATGSSATKGLVQHQLQGLANPFDPTKSTALLHVQLMLDGFVRGIEHPAGSGLSAVTIAGQKFGSTSANTETDPSNAALALGLPGLIAYLCILVLGMRRAYRLASRSRDPLAFAALGVLTVVALQWLNGGEYAVAFLPWLVLGWIDARPGTDPSPPPSVEGGR